MFGYVGGKNKQANWISNQFQSNLTSYAECFGGAMWVYWKTNILDQKYNPNFKEAHYNDIDPLNYCTFKSLKDIEFLQFATEYCKDWFINDIERVNRYRLELIELKDNSEYNWEEVLKFLYVIPHLYNNDLNVINCEIKVYGSDTNPVNKRFLNSKTLRQLSNPSIRRKLNLLKVHNKDFIDFIDSIDVDLLYVDPPYEGTPIDHYRLGHNIFQKEEHLKLADYLNNYKGRFILSYYHFDYIEDIYPTDKYYYLEKEYSVGTRKAVKKTEVLILNYKPSDSDILKF